MKKRLTIDSDLQIFFDNDKKARFISVKAIPIDAVIAELNEWQAFVATWLEEVEEPKVECLNLSQQKLKKQFTPVTKSLSRQLKMTGLQIREILAQLTVGVPQTYPDLSSAQVEHVMDLLAREVESAR